MLGNLIKGFIEILLSKGVPLNENKVKILEYLIKNKEASISEISRELKIDYKNTHRYIQQFKKAGAVKLNPNELSRGKKVMVSLNRE